MNPQNNGHFHCDDIQDHLPFYAAGQMTALERGAIQRHLATCAACREQLATWQIVAEVVRAEAEVRVGDGNGVLPPLEIGIEPHRRREHREEKSMILVKPMRSAQSLRRTPNQKSFITALVALFAAFLLIGIQIVARISPAGQYAATPQGQGVPTNPPVITAENASKLQPISQFGRGMVYDVAWMPDGSGFLVASETGVYAYDESYNGKRLGSDQRRVTAIDIHPDGQSFLAVVDGTLTQHDIETGEITRSITTGRKVMDGQFSPDAKHILVTLCDEDMNLGFCLEAKSVALLNTDSGEYIIGWPDASQAVFKADGSQVALIRLASDGRTPSVQIWTLGDASLPEPHFRFSGYELRDMQFSPDGTQLAILVVDKNSGNEVGRILVYDITTNAGTQIDSIVVEQLPVEFQFTTEGIQYLPATSLDTPAYVTYVVATGERSATYFTKPLFNAYRLLMSPSNERAVVLRNGGIISVWQRGQGYFEPLTQIVDFNQHISSLAFAPDEPLLAVNGYGRLEIWDYAGAEDGQAALLAMREMGLEVGSGDTHSFNSTGGLVYNEFSNAAIFRPLRFWDHEHGFTSRRIGLRSSGRLMSVIYAPDDSLIALYGSSIVPQIWRWTSDGGESQIMVTDQPISLLNGSRFTEDGKILIGMECLRSSPNRPCSDVVGLRLIDAETGQSHGLIETGLSLNGRTQIVQRVANGRTLVGVVGCSQSESGDDGVYTCLRRKIVIWDVTNFLNGSVEEPEEVFTREHEDLIFGAAAISPNGQLLALGHDKKAIMLFDIDSDELVTNVLLHDDNAGALTFNDAGTLLAVGGSGIVRLWAVVE